MRNTKSDLIDSRFPLKLGLHAAPEWKRRLHVSASLREPGQPRLTPAGVPGERVRRSEQVEADANKLGEVAHINSDNDT